MKYFTITLFLFFGVVTNAQVGINTTTPNAQLEIQSSNQALPANTDGILIPKMDVFPATNPTVAQQGMLVYLTTATTFSGNPKPIGFYYWNDTPADWIAVKGTDGGTLDQAYDFGGAGLGKIITADAGAVLINGTDGLVSTGTIGIGAVAPSGTGARMVWNPRKAAFRVGNVTGTLWDDASIGNGSVAFSNATATGTNSFAGAGAVAGGQSSFAFGQGATTNVQDAIALGFFSSASGPRAVALGTGVTASGQSSTAFGVGGTASGFASTAFGSGSTSSGSNSVAFGDSTIASGMRSTAFGFGSEASSFNATAFGEQTFAGNQNATTFGQLNAVTGRNGTAFGQSNVSTSYSETALGIGATTYTPTTNGDTQFRVANASDRLFVIGNAIDTNNNSIVDFAERSDAMVVLKNGSTGIGVSRPVTKLDIRSFNVITTSDSQFGNLNVMTNESQGINKGGAISLGGFNDNALLSSSVFGSIEGRKVNGTSGNRNGYLSFKTNGGAVDGLSERMRITDTGFLGIGTSVPLDRLHVVGNIRMVDGNQAAGKVLTSDVNGTATWQNASVNSWDLLGNLATNPATNFIGTTDNNDLVFKRNNVLSGRLGATNTSFGVNALAGTPLNDNTAFGFNALSTSTVGNTVALGSRALQSNTTGTFNTAVGTGTLLSNIGGFNNIALGFDAMLFNRYGSNNIAIGNMALAGQSFNNGNVSWSTNNLAIGHLALNANQPTNTTNGINNVAVGNATLKSNTLGINNVALGVSSLENSTVGSDNTAMGFNALNNVSTGINNTAVGSNSFSVINQGNNNTALGADTSATSTILDNATAIGYKATVGNSNAMVLGSINGVNGATSSVNVGIGTISPQTALEVVDANAVTSSTGEGIINVLSNNPQASDLGGSITLGGTNNDAATTYRIFGTIEGRKANSTTGSNLGYLMFKTNNGVLGERMRITSSGDVGIGTAIPGGQFELSLNEGRKPGTNTWTIVSDKRLKTINGNYNKGLNEILQLNPIRFNYINNGERKFEQKVLDTEFPGFIAQEVQPLFPDAVGTDADGFLNFNMHPILIASINAFKELNQKNEQLQKENEALKTQLEVQKNNIEAILIRLEKLEKNN